MFVTIYGTAALTGSPWHCKHIEQFKTAPTFDMWNILLLQNYKRDTSKNVYI